MLWPAHYSELIRKGADGDHEQEGAGEAPTVSPTRMLLGRGKAMQSPKVPDVCLLSGVLSLSVRAPSFRPHRSSLAFPESEVCVAKPLLNSTLPEWKRAVWEMVRKRASNCALVCINPSSFSVDINYHTLNVHVWRGLGKDMATGKNSGRCPFNE